MIHGIRGNRSSTLESSTGRIKRGTKEIAAKSPARKVDPVWSNTMKERTKFMAAEPIDDTTVPKVMIVKFLVQSVFLFINHPPHLQHEAIRKKSQSSAVEKKTAENRHKNPFSSNCEKVSFQQTIRFLVFVSRLQHIQHVAQMEQEKATMIMILRLLKTILQHLLIHILS